MNREQLEKIQRSRESFIKLIGDAWPDWLKPKEPCKCGIGIVWGRDVGGDEPRYLQNEAGMSMTMCSDCNDKILDSIYQNKNREAANSLEKDRQYRIENGIGFGQVRGHAKDKKQNKYGEF